MRKAGKFLLTLILFALGVCLIAFVMMVGKTYSVKKDSQNVSLSEAASETAEAVKKLSVNADADTVSGIMEYIKGKSDDGSLSTKEGVKAAIKEGAENYNVEIPDSTVEEISDAVSTLESLGFSTDSLVDATEGVYEKYGVDFMDHMEEAFVEAAKDTAASTAENIWESVEDTISGIFSSKSE